VKSKSEIHDIIKKLAGKGLAIIMISDDIGEIVSTSNRVLIMTAGKVVFEGNTAEISAAQMNDMILRAV
jgi:ABC-type sugar transport system ATPase subunit